MYKVWRGAAFKGYYLAALILNLLSAAFLVLFKHILPPVVPLFYGKPIGEQQLAGSLGLLIIPGVAILITFINFFISLVTKDDFLKKILVTATLIISVLVTITLIKIVSLVGFF